MDIYCECQSPIDRKPCFPPLAIWLRALPPCRERCRSRHDRNANEDNPSANLRVSQYTYIYIHDTSINLKRFSSPTCPAATKDEINGPPGRAGVPSEAHHGIGLAHLWKKGSDGFIRSVLKTYIVIIWWFWWLTSDYLHGNYMEKWSQDGYLIGKFYRISGESGEIIGN